LISEPTTSPLRLSRKPKTRVHNQATARSWQMVAHLFLDQSTIDELALHLLG